MRIGISCEFLGVKRAGTATYSRNLLRGLARLDTGQRYIPYLASRAGLGLVPQAPAITPRVVGPYRAVVRVPLTLPAELLRRPVDLLHTQNWAPPWTPCPLVVTTHDLVWEVHPELFPPLLGLRVRLLARHAARRAVRVIASSRHSAGDIARRYGVPRERIRVIALPVDPDLVPAAPAAVAAVRARYGLDGPYILYVGSIEPRKQVDRLIASFAALRRAHPVPHRLVIAGKPLYGGEAVLDLPARLGLEGLVHFPGQPPDADLAGLFTGADLFATLPAYEGFGLPPLEAMACGTPVVAANTTSLPEALGDAALLVDPLDERAVVAAMARLLSDGGLRGELRERGFRRVRQLAVEPLARQVADVYAEAVAEARDGRARAAGAGRSQRGL